MRSDDHVKISRLMDAAIAELALDDAEKEHQQRCEACQEIFEIFKRELESDAATTRSQNPTGSARRQFAA